MIIFSIAQPIPILTKLITQGRLANDEYNKFYYLYKAKMLDFLLIKKLR